MPPAGKPYSRHQSTADRVWLALAAVVFLAVGVACIAMIAALN